MAHLTNFSFFNEIFTEDASLPILYHGAKKSKMTKNPNQGPYIKTQIKGLNPFTATGYFDIPPPRWPTFLAMLFHILKEGKGLSLLDELEVQYHVIKSNVIQTYNDGAKVTVFARFESESARRHHCSCSRSDAARQNIYRLGAHRLNTRSNNGEGQDFFFFLPSRVFQMYDCYYTNVLTQRSCFEVLLTALRFTRDDARTFVPTIPRRRRAFTVSWNIEVFVHSNSASGVVFFFHQAPPSAVSSPSQSSPSFPSHSLSTRRNQLSPRSPSSRKPSNVQIVPACVASGNIHNAVSRHLDKNRAKHRRTVFSMNKAQESKQRSTN